MQAVHIYKLNSDNIALLLKTQSHVARLAAVHIIIILARQSERNNLLCDFSTKDEGVLITVLVSLLSVVGKHYGR